MSGTDLDHTMGADLAVDSGGDLATARDDDVVRERVLRRLMTNPGGYVWQLDYGGGLAAAIGAPLDVPAIAATVRDQLAREAAVARLPPPKVTAAIAPDNTVTLGLTYSNASNGSSTTVSMAQDP